MSSKQLTSVKRTLSMGLTHILILSMALPAHAASDLTPFFQASGDYTLSYMRYVQLKTTAQSELDVLAIDIENLQELAVRQSNVVDDLKSETDNLQSRVGVIPSIIDGETSAIGEAHATIASTQRAAASSEYYKDGAVVSKATLTDKAGEFQQKADIIQGRINAIQEDIDEQKNDPEYVTLISERNRLELRKDNNLRNIQIRGDENVRLREQIASERQSLYTWREIQVTKRRQRDDIEVNQLPPLESELRVQRDDLEELRRQQSTLIFQKQRLDGEIELKEIELNAESANLNQAELRLNNARARLREAEETLASEPGLRRERARLTGEGGRGGRDGDGRRGGDDRDRNRGGERDRRGDGDINIPQAEALVAERQQAVNEAQGRVNAQEAVRAEKQGIIDGLNQEIQQLDQRIENINRRIAQLEKELEQLGNAASEIERLRGVINQKQNALGQARQAVESQRSVISDRQAAVENLKTQIEPLVAELRELKEKGRDRGQNDESEDAEFNRDGRDRDNRRGEGGDRDRDGDDRRKIRERIRDIVNTLGVDPTLPKDKRKVVNREGLIPQRNRAQNQVEKAEERLTELQGNVASIEAEIQRLEQQIADLGRSGERKREIEQALRQERENLSARSGEKSAKVEQRAQLREQRDAAVTRKQKAQEDKGRAERQLADARGVLRRLNERLADIDRQLDSMQRVRRNLPRLQDAVQDGQREVSTLGRIVQRLADDLSLLLADSAGLRRQIEEQSRRVHNLADIVEDLERRVDRLRDELDQVIADLSQAIEGERASAAFIESAGRTVEDNERLNREALADNRQISEDLVPIGHDISLFEQTRIHPLEDQQADEEVLRDAELVHVNTLVGWADDWQTAEQQIATSERLIEQLTVELADLKVKLAQTQAQLQQAEEAFADTQARLSSSQTQLAQLKVEIQTIESQIAEKEQTLDTIVAQLKQENQDTEPGVIDAVEPVVVDEGFEKISELRQWTAGTVENHKLWNTKACLAYTTVVDGDNNELARLEVYAPVANENGQFSEPVIQVVVSNNSMPILDADLTSLIWDKRRNRLVESMKTTATYLSDQNQNGDLQGLGSRLADTEEMISRLRADHTFKATLNDAAGAIMDLEFSLSGSSATIKKAFEECGLKFSELPEVN